MTAPSPQSQPKPPTPRWVIVSGIVAAIVVILLLLVILLGGGEHGPGRHMKSSGDQVLTEIVR
ncbi:hypothetical protein AB0J48_34960 [Nocardia salmonicida]|uniref:hypothetical protein n=1 Tax=Nocardia salmonicida TaxID=53431 RepID=UPI0034489C12